MANFPLGADSACANPASDLFSAALRFEDMACHIERIRAVAWGLSASEVIEENARDSFSAIADLCSASLEFARKAEEEFTAKSARHR